MSNKYEQNDQPPPGYPQQPQQAYGSANNYYSEQQDPRGQPGYYGSPVMQGGLPQPQQYPQGGYQQPYQQGPYPPQGQMYYQQQPGYGPQGGYYGGGGQSNSSGLCAGLLGGLACCCCLDLCLF